MGVFAPAGPRYTRRENVSGKRKDRVNRRVDTDQLHVFHRQDAIKCEGGKEEAEKERIARRPKGWYWVIARRINRRRFLGWDVAQGVSRCCSSSA